MKRAWPKISPDAYQPPYVPRGCTLVDDGWNEQHVPPALCKHGRGDCETCGTTERREQLHTTRGGRGVVGRLGRR